MELTDIRQLFQNAIPAIRKRKREEAEFKAILQGKDWTDEQLQSIKRS